MKLSDIADAVGAKIENASPAAEITAVAGIEHAAPGELTFVSNPKYNAAARTTKASAVIVSENFPALSTGMLRSKNPYLAWAKAIELFYQPPRYSPGIHPSAVIHSWAKLGKNAHVAPYVVIDQDVVVGDNAVLLAHVVLYRGVSIGHNFFAHAHAVVREFCQLGDNVLLQNGVVVGSDGFGFAKDDAGHWHKIVQSGNVVIESDAELQANSCIDRGAYEDTVVGEGTKIDNLVQIAHNVILGRACVLAAHTGLAGSITAGDGVQFGGKAGLADHLTIGPGAKSAAGAGVISDVPAGETWAGYPARSIRRWLRETAWVARQARKSQADEEE